MKTLRKKELKRFRIVATIHKDVTERLEKINASLAAETRKVLDINKSERHIRGGLATKRKVFTYARVKNVCVVRINLKQTIIS